MKISRREDYTHPSEAMMATASTWKVEPETSPEQETFDAVHARVLARARGQDSKRHRRAAAPRTYRRRGKLPIYDNSAFNTDPRLVCEIGAGLVQSFADPSPFWVRRALTAALPGAPQQ